MFAPIALEKLKTKIHRFVAVVVVYCCWFFSKASSLAFYWSMYCVCGALSACGCFVFDFFFVSSFHFEKII